jgi:ectoine hydroxylase-related dioxygenase (phytanoyl-CoA dioxygenase family)
VVGSHRWNDERKPRELETAPALMARGSVLLIDGGLHHGGGRNDASSPRTALLLASSLGWLRPGENPQLSEPPHLAKDLPKALREQNCYRTNGLLGSFDGAQPSMSWQRPGKQHPAALDLNKPELEALQIRRR